MRLLIVLRVCMAGVFGCNSSDDDSSADSGSTDTGISSRNIVGVNGATVPAEADLIIVWGRVSDRQDIEFFIDGAGEMSDGSFTVETPFTVPPDAILETNVVAQGIILAFPKGMAPAPGAYSEDADVQNPQFIGVVNEHSIIYRPSGVVLDEFITEFDGWWEDFNPGFECAKNIEGGDQEFDYFEPIDCSEIVLRIGNPEDVPLVGGDWE